MVHLTTAKGSEYVLDMDRRLWECAFISPKTDKPCVMSGSFRWISCELGKPLKMKVPTMVRPGEDRYVETSPIVHLEVK